jgi:hypothetical protein
MHVTGVKYVFKTDKETEILSTSYLNIFTAKSKTYTGITRILVLSPATLPALVVIQFITSWTMCPPLQ